jgi:MFS family permease
MERTIENKWRSCFIVFSASLFFFYQFTQANIISSLAPYLMQTFSIDATHLGKLSASYFFATILFLLPAGQILDRFSTRKVILTVLMISIFGAFSFAFASSYWTACLSRFFMGIGDAFCLLSAIRIASRWFPNKKLAFVSGVIVTIGMMGAMLAQTPLAMLIQHTGNWRYAIIIDGILGFIFWILIFLVVKDRPPEKEDKRRKEHERFQQLGYWNSICASYGKMRNWLCAFYTCLIGLSIFLIGSDGFGSLYLQQVRHMTILQASYPPTMIFFGMAVGAPLSGYISDSIHRRKLPMQFGAIISIVLMLCIIYMPVSTIIYTILFFLLGLISSTGNISYVIVTETNSKELTTTSISIISFVSLSGATIFPPLFGYIMDKGNHFKIIHNIHVYNVIDYHNAMLIIPLAMLVAWMTTLFIPENYCKSYDG